MSIQPNRVIHRIVDQVDRSDWPPLASRTFSSSDEGEMIRVYQSPALERYATPLHFWVHALRDELAATERRVDLVGAAGHALCRNQSLEQWRDEITPFLAKESVASQPEGRASQMTWLRDPSQDSSNVQVYRMLESECRRSSVVDHRSSLVAHFWGHGAGASWRRKTLC